MTGRNKHGPYNDLYVREHWEEVETRRQKRLVICHVILFWEKLRVSKQFLRELDSPGFGPATSKGTKVKELL